MSLFTDDLLNLSIPPKAYETIIDTNKYMQDFEPMSYENSIFADMAEDISNKFEPQISSVATIAEASRSMADSAVQQNKLTQKQVDALDKQIAIQQEQLDTYKKEIEDATRDARHSRIVSRLSIAIALASLLIDALQYIFFI